MHSNPIGAGGNSFQDINHQKLFQELEINVNTVFLDLACGYGDYSIEAANYIGDSGQIYAIDLWPQGIEELKRKIDEKSIKSVKPIQHDVRKKLPLSDNSIDTCLISAVLHDFVEDNTEKKVLKQVARIIKPKGRVAILEFKKEEGRHGPPKEIRLSPQEVKTIMRSYNFKQEKYSDLGASHYLMTFNLR